MPSATSASRPAISDTYQIGKLPTVSVRKNMDRGERRLCVGRVWIFLLLGVLLIVLGLVSVGVYFNIEGITSSSKYTEIMPLYINAGAIVFAGLSVCLLFWKRLKFLVFVSVVMCIATGFLCGIAAVLTSTHVLQPLQSFSTCRYYVSQLLCQCFSPYKRDMLTLDYSETEETKYDFEDTSSCSSIENVIPQLLYTLVAVYAIVFLVCLGSAIVSLLVLRTERIKRGFFEDEAYEEVYTVSGSSSVDQSDSEVDVSAEVITSPTGQSLPLATSGVKDSSIRNINVFQSEAVNSSRSGSLQPVITNLLNAGSVSSSLSQKTPIVQRSKTPVALNDLGKESLANRYRITKTPDSEFPRNTRQRLSKTPDREIQSHRRSSFSYSKRLSRSCDSLDSSEKGNQEVGQGFGTSVSDGKKKGKLKEHRRKGKRAATIHTLDTDQLLLILNLQMRYLQETKQQQSQKDLSKTTRRAITPQPASQKQVIPQRIRSHTPQPYRANGRNRDQLEQEFYSQVDSLNRKLQNSEVSHTGAGNFRRSSRVSSDSSARSADIHTGKLRGGGGRYNDGSDTDQSGNFSNGYFDKDGMKLRHENYLMSQQMCNTAPIIREGHNPYIHVNSTNTSADNLHYVTYSDSMLSKESSKPKSRASVQNYFLPPEPIHRNTKNMLPPQPITRQHVAGQQLPPQPIHRGTSAFHVVDRHSKSRSPSVGSDRMAEHQESTPRRKTRKDIGDAAIRENFQMNPNPFFLRDSHGNASNCDNIPNKLIQRRNFPDLETGYQPPEILPPYSGPPSYKEYVSSCDNSVTSSLSSNPDDIYSTPRRRIQRDQNLTNQSESDTQLTNQRFDNQPQAHNLNSIYGNAEQFQNMQNKQRQGQRNKSESHRSKGQAEVEAIYSSPARSRVKQYVVPENYYTTVDKSKRSKHSSNENMTINQVTIDLTNGNERHIQQNMQDYVRMSASQNTYPVMAATPLELHGYESAKVSKQSGFINTDNIGASESHQIAPDAKYHEYEDVYNTPDNLPELPQNSLETSVYSGSTRGSEMNNAKSKSKSKQKSPKKPRAPYPVSNVNARIPDFVNSGAVSINTLVSDSVQNVHAENVNNIPRIKLNDLDTSDVIDDDVFEDSNTYSSNVHVSREACAVGGNVNTKDLPRIPQFHSNNPLEPHCSITNENSVQGHVIDLACQENNSGYMKMTLPSKTVATVVQTSNESTVANHMSGQPANEITATNHVTVDFTNENERHVPEGTEDESEESNGEYEETGV